MLATAIGTRGLSRNENHLNAGLARKRRHLSPSMPGLNRQLISRYPFGRQQG